MVSPFRRSPPKTLARGTAAMAEGAQARALAVAGYLAVQRGIPLGRAWTRGARLLRSPRMEDQGLTAHRLRRGGQGRRHMAFDGTAGHHDFKRLLASSWS